MHTQVDSSRPTQRDEQRAADVMDQHVMRLIGRGEVNTVHAWLEAAPPALVLRRPRLSAARAWVNALAGPGTIDETILRQVEEELQRPDGARSGPRPSASSCSGR